VAAPVRRSCSRRQWKKTDCGTVYIESFNSMYKSPSSFNWCVKSTFGNTDNVILPSFYIHPINANQIEKFMSFHENLSEGASNSELRSAILISIYVSRCWHFTQASKMKSIGHSSWLMLIFFYILLISINRLNAASNHELNEGRLID